ncbi:MAG: class I SAM-dependent methyltransferase [Bacteroidales bacterium]
MNMFTIILSDSRFLLQILPGRLFFRIAGLTAVFFTVLFIFRVEAQDLDVPYVPTPTKVVNKMLEVADVGAGDYVIDLGSGDGRIMIAAAQRGAYGHGVDIDPERVREAEGNARKAGVSDKVLFLEENIFNTDFRRASVVTMYLLSSVNMKLRSRLLDSLEPGTRVVSHDFDMGDWEPDKHLVEDEDDIFFWIIPAEVEGQWIWETNGIKFKVTARQKYQEVELQVLSGDEALIIKEDERVLVGDRLGFTAFNTANGNRYVYCGRVEGDTITGKVQIRRPGDNNRVENWSATIYRGIW